MTFFFLNFISIPTNLLRFVSKQHCTPFTEYKSPSTENEIKRRHQPIDIQKMFFEKMKLCCLFVITQQWYYRYNVVRVLFVYNLEKNNTVKLLKFVCAH